MTTPEEYKRLWLRYDYSETVSDGSEVPRTRYATIGSLLGYATPVDPANPNLQITDYTTTGSTVIYGKNSEFYELVRDIVATQVLLSQALQDSMAKEVGELVLDMGTYITNLRLQGSTKLAQLSKFTGIPLEVDSFTGRVFNNNTTPFSIKNLF